MQCLLFHFTCVNLHLEMSKIWLKQHEVAIKRTIQETHKTKLDSFA